MSTFEKLLRHMRYLGLGAVLTASMTGCSGEPDVAGGPDEDEFASFGGDGAKNNGDFKACEVVQALHFVNEANTTIDMLRMNGVGSRAAANIIEKRNGPDQTFGTADDFLFEDLNALDDVRYVGQRTLEKLVERVAERCEDALDEEFIDESTFAGQTLQTGRNGTEAETAFTVQGMTGPELNALVTSFDSRDRLRFTRFRKSDAMEAFSYDVPIEEMPWSGDANRARLALPFITMHIESGRFEIDADDGRRELSLGTDYFSDTYYDDRDYNLLLNSMVVRGRARWDVLTENPSEAVARRLLIAAKLGCEIDSAGIKSCGKIDARKDSPSAADIAALDRDVRRGKTSWGWNSGADGTPLEAVHAVYERLTEANALRQDVPGRQNVLMLEPKAHLFSLRSRFHNNLTSERDKQDFYANGHERIRLVNGYAQGALDAGIVPAGEVSEVMRLITMGEGILDGSLLRSRAGAAADAKLPSEWGENVADRAELDTNRAISIASTELGLEYGELADDLKEAIAGTDDLDGDDYVEYFELWQHSVDPSSRRFRVMKPFLEKYEGLAGNAAQAIADFNAYGMQQRADGNNDFEDYEPITEALWMALEAHLRDEVIKYSHRMIEAGGQMAQSIWFNQAREFYIPASSAGWGSSNFLINTFDFTQMVTHEVWKTLDESETLTSTPISAQHVFHSTLVNEVQIELGSETAFIEALNELQAKVDDGTITAEEMDRYNGVKFVVDEYLRVMQVMTELREEELLERMEDAGAPNTITWGPAERSKGAEANRRLALEEGIMFNQPH